MEEYLYANKGELHATDYLEIYIPMLYFEDGGKFSKDTGATLNCLGLLYIRKTIDGKEGPIRFLNIPTWIDLSIHDSTHSEIKVRNKNIPVLVLKYMKGSHVMHQTLPMGREIAEKFLDLMLSGKLPRTINYSQIIDIWWKNLEISGANFKVPSKIYEMIIANIYRSPVNAKQRFGEVYGNSPTPNGYSYKTGNVRDVVEGLSTFSGMVFEDMSRMITSGINNSMDGIEEAISPLEKIIYY